jgi:hypothetical protein
MFVIPNRREAAVRNLLFLYPMLDVTVVVQLEAWVSRSLFGVILNGAVFQAE